jgi:RNA polymerase sigma factor (sigma-70 family)
MCDAPFASACVSRCAHSAVCVTELNSLSARNSIAACFDDFCIREGADRSSPGERNESQRRAPVGKSPLLKNWLKDFRQKSDLKLVVREVSGAEAEWRAEILGQQDWLRGHIASSLDAGEPVQDVLHQTLEAAITTGRPESLQNLQAWLGGIARNKLRQFVERKSRERRLTERFGNHEAVYRDAEPTPLAVLVHHERHSLTRAALDQLDAEDAALLRRKYLDQWSYQQMADELGWNQATLTNRLHRARRRLRGILQGLRDEL